MTDHIEAQAAATAANAEHARMVEAHYNSPAEQLSRAEQRAAFLGQTNDTAAAASAYAEVERLKRATAGAYVDPTLAPPVVTMSETERLGRQDLAAHGLGSKGIDEIINGKPPSQEDFVTALARKEMALADKDWVSRWESGGLLEQNDMLVWNAIIMLGQEALKGR
jgi:hypothetical protein